MRRKMILIGTLITALGIALVPMRSDAAPKARTYVISPNRNSGANSGNNCNSNGCNVNGGNSNGCNSTQSNVCQNQAQLYQFLQEYVSQHFPGLTIQWPQDCQTPCNTPECNNGQAAQAPCNTPDCNNDQAAQAPCDTPDCGNGQSVQVPCDTPDCGNNQPSQDAPAVPSEQAQAPQQEQPAPSQSLSYEEQVVALVNAERAKEGLPALTMDAKLQEAARARAKETVTLFSHTRPNGTSCFTILQEYGISYRYAGENIAYGQRSPEEVVNAWMNSEGHRANIMSKNFTTIGIGYYQTANGTKYWSQLFTS